MLTIYRRHTKKCPHRGKGRAYRRCRCPIWVDGVVGLEEIRESLRTRDWQKAQQIVRAWEAEGRRARGEEESEPVSIDAACEAFMSDAEARGLRPATLKKYRVLFEQLREFARQGGFRYLYELDLPALRRFRESWRDRPVSAVKKLERLRAFYRFAAESRWIAENPALLLRNPKVSQRPTEPFSQEEMVRILAACEQYSDDYARRGLPSSKRVRALILLLRYSGLRIGDAAACERKHLRGDRLFLYTHKTGVPVYCKLPRFVVEALEEMPTSSERYFFWSGIGSRENNTETWRRRIRKVFELAGIENGHPHRFRDTFAVELLLAGVPMERVSVLLGHSSIRVTERHYAPWVRSRQEQLEADLERAWARDPVAVLFTKGTREVHGRKESQN